MKNRTAMKKEVKLNWPLNHGELMAWMDSTGECFPAEFIDLIPASKLLDPANLSLASQISSFSAAQNEETGEVFAALVAYLKKKLVFITESRGRVIYEVTDPEKFTVQEISNDIEDVVCQIINTSKVDGLEFPMNHSGKARVSDVELYKLFRRNNFLDSKAVDIMGSIDSMENPCLFRRTTKIGPEGPTPFFDEFMSRLDSPGIFAAWYYAVYAGVYRDRRALWLYGKDGQEGKSAVVSALNNILFGGVEFGVARGQASKFKKQNNHMTSGFVNKSLLYFPEVGRADRGLIETDDFKSITGGDPSQVEAKFKNIISVQMFIPSIIVSNLTPYISNAGHSTSRLAFIEITGAPKGELMDSEEVQRVIKNELPSFLAKGKRIWDDIKTTNGYMAIPDNMKETIDKLATNNDNRLWSRFFKSYSPDATGTMFLDDFRGCLEEIRTPQHDLEAIVKLLDQKKGSYPGQIFYSTEEANPDMPIHKMTVLHGFSERTTRRELKDTRSKQQFD